MLAPVGLRWSRIAGREGYMSRHRARSTSIMLAHLRHVVHYLYKAFWEGRRGR